mmetsp:Transcript_47522/g.83064  ORF Transcript_47522/g.83064 Transcript_47522/m.83064 type:complete len:203 (+) Transcript_47522:777-1385(+)
MGHHWVIGEHSQGKQPGAGIVQRLAQTQGRRHVNALGAGQQPPGGLFLRPGTQQAAIIRQRVGDAAAVALQQQPVTWMGRPAGVRGNTATYMCCQGTAVRGKEESVAHSHCGGVLAVGSHVDAVHSHANVRPARSAHVINILDGHNLAHCVEAIHVHLQLLLRAQSQCRSIESQRGPLFLGKDVQPLSIGLSRAFLHGRAFH